MDLNQLNTFFTLAKTRSFTRYAQKRFITQSAVSRAIRELENSLDHSLIKKKGQFLYLCEEKP
ncbi:MAG: LysR family transcriptional regulator [Pseudomonadota bacterium]